MTEGWSKLVNMIPDESYWSMLAQHLGHKITGDLTTYMEPGDAKTGHSKMFTDQDVPRLWAQPKPSFFARKFATTPKILAVKLAPSLHALTVIVQAAAPATSLLPDGQRQEHAPGTLLLAFRTGQLGRSRRRVAAWRWRCV